MSKPWIFVSPSSRGIGHALTAHILRSTTLPILATARSDLCNVKESILAAAAAPAPAPAPTSSCGTTQIHKKPQTQMEREDDASRLHVTYVDVTDESGVKAASEKAAALFPPASHHLHLAFALPGVLHPEKHPRQIDHDAALETLEVNVLGPLLLMKWFGELLPRKGTDLSRMQEHAMGMRLDKDMDMDMDMDMDHGGGSSSSSDGEKEKEQFHIPAHATWLTNSARVGSTTDNRLGGWYTYRASKAGVNSITKSFDLHLQTRSAEKAMAIAYHPGTVKTELSRAFWDSVAEEKLFGTEFAARKMLEVVSGRTLRDRGRCWDWKGEEVLP